MTKENIIIGGDLNFSLGHVESCGNHAQTNSLMDIFEHILDYHIFFNIDMARIQPTWRNRRIGEAILARILDHFLIKA